MGTDVGVEIEDTQFQSLRLFAKYLYIVLFVITLVLASISMAFGYGENLVVSIPIIVIMALTIFTDRRYVHIPPVLILMMMATFYVAVIGRMVSDSLMVVVVMSFLNGVNLGLIGLILVYMLMKSMPGVRDENPNLVTFMVMSVATSVFSVVKLIQFIITQWWDGMEAISINAMMWELLLTILGSLVVCILYRSDESHRLFRYTLGGFLAQNSELLGLDDREKAFILDLIKTGESEKLEFKSTLRTNIETGETDKRMEKAVLKTLVAFLNTDGGTLLVGVSDDGSIRGADEESFANRDKMGLHLTNLIASQIGNGFLPYISFKTVDFDGKAVIWVRCLECPKPVFLKDGKIEIFYVRSGPSTVELTGMNLINYVNNRRTEMVRRGRMFD